MKAWKISGGIVLLLYVVISVFICIRKVDGAGVVQTLEMRNITLIIWGGIWINHFNRLSNLAGNFKA
ncbi:DUF3923 family protein [Lactobacillus taiwanensis]|uniref:DUF3923 family protein n=1 Tax=Lactobacillus taiwanensis TaxID=508451 RepID=UPI00211ACF0D|nr:DUF3923 family protein [Lactobacillus taiwanensis]MCR1916134.1 DUF3923 family protein [Lactobacillus taiwanensis]